MVRVADPHWYWSLAVITLGAALTCWPASPARGRVYALLPSARGSRAALSRVARWVMIEPRRAIAVLAVVSLAGGVLAGWGGAVASLIITGVGYRYWRERALQQRQSAEVAALVEAVGVMAAELRAGAHPATAAAAASVGGLRVHRVLASVAAGARLGAQVPALLQRQVTVEPVIADELSRLAAAWTLAEQHGAALAELMEAVRGDMEARLRLSGQIKAQLSGPRVSAAVLAGLPILGIALGQGIGAHPLAILTTTPVGQVLLVLGTGLAAAGLLWSARITAKAAP